MHEWTDMIRSWRPALLVFCGFADVEVFIVLSSVWDVGVDIVEAVIVGAEVDSIAGVSSTSAIFEVDCLKLNAKKTKMDNVTISYNITDFFFHVCLLSI